MAEPDPRMYRADEVVAFRKTGEAFGGLSNMAPGFPLWIAGVSLRTSEALYQACRFPHRPEVQRLIVEQVSPMTAKMRSKPYRNDSREHWDDLRVPVMKWCLRVKLAQNWTSFGDLILATGGRAIVEDSRKDDFWGAIRDADGNFHGRNVLGRLLMELREKLRQEPDSLKEVAPLKLQDFTLLGHEIPLVAAETSRAGERRKPAQARTETLHLWASS
ncbi:NADAR family protein [Methylobacterium sp. J-078]|uniref:NADAR family protein n=1 Tax=Methylobacterium sp. J-078 TaxID=2836657 RepID=UPI001FBBCCD2|nr:NADAR family protein [Methylobacterium sp. J-078]MCJ2045267.1 NADAR family protein [Methylobacterium sp. J-078]